MEQKSIICKVAALLLAVLTVTPTFLAVFAYATPVGRPGPESQFIEKLKEAFNEYNAREYLLIEAKALKDDKAQLVAELIRDMYMAQTNSRVGKVVYVYPAHDMSMRDWVKGWVEKVGEKYQKVFGRKGGGALGEGALVEYASDEYLKEWMGLEANTVTRLLGIAGQIVLTVLFYAIMNAPLVHNEHGN